MHQMRIESQCDVVDKKPISLFRMLDGGQQTMSEMLDNQVRYGAPQFHL